MHQHKESINTKQCVQGSWPTKNLKRPEEPKVSLPACTVNGMKVANLTAISNITFPEQLHLFTLPDVYAASHVRPIKRRTALCSECQSDRKRMFPFLRILKPTITPERRVPRCRLLSILPPFLSKVYMYKILQTKSL